MRGVLLLLLLTAAACGSGAKAACTATTVPQDVNSGATWSDPPSSAEIINLVLRNEALEIRAEQPGCDSVFGSPVPPPGAGHRKTLSFAGRPV